MGKMSDYGTRCAGHEGAGVIVKVGEQVKKLKPGMRAGFKPIADTCGSCEQCRTDKECYCTGAVFTGLHTDGKISITFCLRSCAGSDLLSQARTNNTSSRQNDTQRSSRMEFRIMWLGPSCAAPPRSTPRSRNQDYGQVTSLCSQAAAEVSVSRYIQLVLPLSTSED